MQSSKVSPGDTATATQYNNLRADAMQAGFYAINVIVSDATYPITEENVGDITGAGFAGSGTSSCFFDILIPPQIDTGEDWDIIIDFDMDSAESSKAIRLSLDYAVIDDTEDTTPTPTTIAETVSTPDAAEILKSVKLSTIKIPSSSLISGSLISCKLSRLADHAGDTHGGKLRILQMQLTQSQT